MHGQILVELQEMMGSDASICNSAWTSTYDKDKREDKYDDPEKVAALIPRLIRDGHSTPVESVIFRFWIRLPIYIDREHMTHRIATHSGLSGRYRTMPDDFYSLPKDVVGILSKVYGEAHAKTTVHQYDDLCRLTKEFYRSELKLYKDAEAAGAITNAEYKRLRETVRGCLPIAGMVERTSIFNLRSFANYYRLRSAPGAAKEIQQIAHMMLAEVEKANVCPLAIAALKEAHWRI